MNNIYSRPMFQNPQQRAGGGIMAGVAPINLDQGGSVSDFVSEQSSASEGGLLGAIGGNPVTIRDATDFFLVDPNDPVDVAIATLSVGLLFFPPAAAAATLARYGWKGKKAFSKLAEAQKRFAPSKDDKGAVAFAKRRVIPEIESIKGGLGGMPGARVAQYETNRALGQLVPLAIDPEARQEFSDSVSLDGVGENFEKIADLGGQLYEQRVGETVGETFGGIADLTPLAQLYEQGQKFGVGEKISDLGGQLYDQGQKVGEKISDAGEQLYDQTFGGASPEESPAQETNNPPSEQTLGQRINNPFNIKFSESNDWRGADTSLREGEYEGFGNSDDGIRAADRVLKNYGKNSDIETLRGTINRYAPPSENPTKSYLDYISEKTGIDPDEKIDLSDPSIRATLLSPMAQFESRSTFSPDQISAAISRSNEGNDESILDSVASGEYVSDGGIADVARNISEAREMKSSTFKRGDKDLAAVTAEDLEESGFDSLREYLNNMDFDSESGRYAPQEMANGGIMRLKDGSGPDGVEERVIPPEIEGLLNDYNISLEEFLKYPDEKKEAYIKSYQDTLDFKRSMVDPRLQSPAGGVAAILDVANTVLEAPTNIYEAAKYSDLGKVFGFSDPDQERPKDDPSFAEDIERIRTSQAPSLSEVNDLIPKAPEPIESETVEEEPGIIQKAFGAVGKIAGFDLPENERRAMLAAAGRRKYGVSRQQAYENSMFNQAKIADMQATTAARGTSETQKGLEYLKELFPDKSDEVLVDLLFQKGKNKVTNSELAAAILEETASIRKGFLENNSQEVMNDENVDRAAKGLPELSVEEWINQSAKKNVYAAYNMQNPGGTSPAPAASLSKEEYEKLLSQKS